MAVELIVVVFVDVKVPAILHGGHWGCGEGWEVLMCGVVWCGVCCVLCRMCDVRGVACFLVCVFCVCMVCGVGRRQLRWV
jgi:hypothetical protein